MRLACLQIEKAENEAAGKAEQRGAECRRHAVQGRLQPGFQIGEGAGEVACPDIERADDTADRAHRLEQPVKCPKEAEKHQDTNQIARGLAGFVEPRCDAVEQGLQRGRRQADPAALSPAEHARQRPQEPRRRPGRRRQIPVRKALAEAVDPGTRRSEQQYLAKNIEDPGKQNPEDHAVDRRVAHEGGVKRATER